MQLVEQRCCVGDIMLAVHAVGIYGHRRKRIAPMVLVPVVELILHTHLFCCYHISSQTGIYSCLRQESDDRGVCSGLQNSITMFTLKADQRVDDQINRFLDSFHAIQQSSSYLEFAKFHLPACGVSSLDHHSTVLVASENRVLIGSRIVDMCRLH
jgi:hypothetical protein